MPSDFLTTTVPYLIVTSFTMFGFAYATYISLTVWRGLSVPIYKSRALWTGVLGIAITISIPVSGNENVLFPGNLHILGIILVYIGLFPISILGIYAWMDRTITTLVRLDYLRRDLLWWSKMRYVYWVIAIISTVLYYAGFVYLQLLQSIQGSPVWGISYLVSLLVPLTYASAAILIGSRRTTDHTFRLHAKWIGYTILTLILISLISQVTISDAVLLVISGLPNLLFAYSFYKVARYLVPVGKFRAD